MVTMTDQSSDIAGATDQAGESVTGTSLADSPKRSPRRSKVDRRSGMDRRRGPGRRLGELRREAEEGRMAGELLEFVNAIDEYKRVNDRPFPSWSEIFEVVHYLGYRKVADVAEHINTACAPETFGGTGQCNASDDEEQE